MPVPTRRPAVTVTIPGYDEPLTVVGGSLRLDQTRNPYGSGLLEIPLTYLQDVIGLLDPRKDVRLTVAAGEEGQTPRSFDLGLRTRPLEADGARERVLQLTVATDEAMLHDYAPLADDTTPRSYQASLRAVCNYVLGKVGAELEVGSEDADVTAYWPITNLVENPSYETGVNGYANSSGVTAFSSIVVSSPTPPLGTHALRVTAAAGVATFYPAGYDNAASAFKAIRVTPGVTYTAQIWVLSSVARSAQIGLHFRAENGITAVRTFYSVAAVTTTGTWTRFSVTAEAPAGASYAAIIFTTTGNTAGQFHYLDAAMLYAGNEVIPAFDGATANDAYYTYAWAGDAHASQSTRTPVILRYPESLTWLAGTIGWDFLEPLNAGAGLRLWCDEDRKWRLENPALKTPDVHLPVSGDNAVQLNDTISREDAETWCTGVVIRYTWRDANGIQRSAVDSAGLPGKVLTVEKDTAFPGPGAAAAMLGRRSGRGHVQVINVLGQWSASPGMEVGVVILGQEQLNGTLTAVDWDLATGLMELTTAETIDVPPGSWASTDPSEAWIDPPDITWDEWT